jgi:signal transduction histidine kinase
VQNLLFYKELYEHILNAQTEERQKEVELHMQLPSGDACVLRAAVTKLRVIEEETNESETYVLIVLENISDRIQLEEQLIHSEKIASMGQLATSIAHELGNPLSAMSAILQDVKQHPQRRRSKVQKEIDVVMDNLKQMDELLRDITTFVAPRQPHFGYADLHSAIAQTLTLVSQKASQQNIKIRTNFIEHIPQCYVDIRQLKQVFLNLIKNSMEAMPYGGVLTVETSLLTRDDLWGTDSILVQISDTGVGIPADELNMVFKLFYTTKENGTGLGLSLCRMIIEEHGGSISVASTVGKGTTFTITIPLER